jgi:hypothetical protein
VVRDLCGVHSACLLRRGEAQAESNKPAPFLFYSGLRTTASLRELCSPVRFREAGRQASRADWAQSGRVIRALCGVRQHRELRDAFSSMGRRDFAHYNGRLIYR